MEFEQAPAAAALDALDLVDIQHSDLVGEYPRITLQFASFQAWRTANEAILAYRRLARDDVHMVRDHG